MRPRVGCYVLFVLTDKNAQDGGSEYGSCRLLVHMPRGDSGN